MSDFAPGFASRHDRAGEALNRAFGPVEGFTAYDVADRARGGTTPTGFAPNADGPQHFSPASKDHNPTEGWDPFRPDVAAGDEGFSDPIEAARTAGFDAGKLAARSEDAAADERDAAMIERIGEALSHGSHLNRDKLAEQLRTTVLKLVRGVIDDAGICGDLLAARVEAAVEMLADSAESAILRVNPDDVALLDGKLPKTVFPVGDATIERGSFTIESASSIIEDGPELWLDQLTETLDRVAVPASC